MRTHLYFDFVLTTNILNNSPRPRSKSIQNILSSLESIIFFIGKIRIRVNHYKQRKTIQ